MSADFGVEPTQKESDYYFVSYNTEDADRVGKICRFMHSVHPEIDFWYDKGIRHDDQWSAKIAQKIDKCKEMIFFFTRGIFEKGSERFENGQYKRITDVWTFQEYQTARDYDKKILVVYLDNVDINNVCHAMVSWYEELKPKNGLQGIMAYNEEPETVAQYIFRELTEQSIPFTVESINAKHKKSKSRNNFHVDKTITKTKNIGTFVAFVCIISIVLFVILQKSTLNNNRENDKNIEAYRNFLLEYNSSEKKHKDDKWGLFYLNDDDIPELFITNNSTAGNGPNVYTIKDHKVIQINDEMSGSYGSFLYSERNNCYVRLYSHSVFWVAEIFKLEDGSLFLEWKVTANRGYDETAISVEYGENELEKYKAYKESKGFSLYSGVTNEVYGIYCDYLSENNLRKKWRYDESKGELWSNFKCQYKNSIEETLSIDDFKKEYNKYLPDNLISVGPSNCLEFEENIINRCYEYAMSEDDINSAL